MVLHVQHEFPYIFCRTSQNNNVKSPNMIFLTVVACEIGRNRYFAGTNQGTGSGYLVGIMGNMSYK